MASLSNFRWQNRKERSNRSTKIGDMDIKAKYNVEVELFNHKQ